MVELHQTRSPYAALQIFGLRLVARRLGAKRAKSLHFIGCPCFTVLAKSAHLLEKYAPLLELPLNEYLAVGRWYSGAGEGATSCLHYRP